MKSIQLSQEDRIFNIVLSALLALICFLMIYPLYFIVIASFTDPYIVNSGKFLLWPEKLYLAGYERIFEYMPLWKGYRNSIVYTALTVVCALVTTIPAAYVLSRRDMVFRSGIMILYTFTMFFSGGIIPTYLLIKELNLLNTIWAVILPVSGSAWNLIVARTFFQESIPEELLEASKIDGADDFRFFFQIVIPLSKTILAVIALFFAVSQWNSYFNALMYLSEDNKMPLQLVLEDEFGTGKRAYGLNRIMAHLRETSFCVIGVALLCMNLTKRLRSPCLDLFTGLMQILCSIDRLSAIA